MSTWHNIYNFDDFGTKLNAIDKAQSSSKSGSTKHSNSASNFIPAWLAIVAVVLLLLLVLNWNKTKETVSSDNSSTSYDSQARSTIGKALGSMKNSRSPYRIVGNLLPTIPLNPVSGVVDLDSRAIYPPSKIGDAPPAVGNLIDGNIQTYWNPVKSNDPTVPYRLLLNLNGVYQITSISVLLTGDIVHDPQGFEVYSDAAFTKLITSCTLNSGIASVQVCDSLKGMDPTSTVYLKVLAPKPYGTLPPAQIMIKEIALQGYAWSPI